MARLFGRDITRRALLDRTGDLMQVAGIRLMTLADGPESGVRIADCRTGSGLRFQVTLDRGMDISVAEYRGIPLAFRSPAGDVHPSHFEPAGTGWLRTFPGGLMTGCGLTSVGSPSTDAGEDLGQHGRLSHLQAERVSSSSVWDGEECTFALSGELRQSATFAENILLTRVIETRLGRSVIALHDSVRNEGRAASPLMMLYHINAGWPLLDESARLLLNVAGTAPRDADAAPGLADARTFGGPVKGYAEQVFYHECLPGEDGFASVMLRNPSLGIALVVRFRTRELRRLIQWKMTAEGTYVLGIEPANCLVEGRKAERERGTLRFLEPGQEEAFEVEIGVAEGESEIASFIGRHRLS